MINCVKFKDKKEIFKFQNLIKKNWSNKKHIFTKNKNLILFYYNFLNKRFTNILGILNKNEIVAALGLIPNNNWDVKLNKDYFLAFLIKSNQSMDASFRFFEYIYKK